MSSRSHFLRSFWIHTVTAAGCLLVVAPSLFGQVEEAQPPGVPLDSLPPLAQARQYLIARQFAAALIEAEDAAEQYGIEPAGVHHDGYASASFDTASVHLYRGLALELQRRFPEARADYDVFLSIEPDSWRADELRKRYEYVSGQTLRFNARALRDEGIAPDSGKTRFTIGVFPFYNASSILVMSQVSYGLTGVLSNTLALLNDFTDQDLTTVPYSETRLLLDEILPDEVYGAGAEIELGSLARVLQVEYLSSGMLDEVSGSLTGHARIGSASDMSTMRIDDLQASYTSVGLLDLQRSLTMAIADSIQSCTGFSWVPSRQAYADSVESYLIDDVGKLLTYGYAFEQLLLGEPVEAQALMQDLPDKVALLDLAQIPSLSNMTTAPADNLHQLTALNAADAVVETVEPDTVVFDTTAAVPVEQVLPVATAASIQETRTAHVISAASAGNLSGFAVWGPTQRSLRFDLAPRGDSRLGVAGTLDPTRMVPAEPEVPIKVIITLPTFTKSAQPATTK